VGGRGRKNTEQREVAECDQGIAMRGNVGRAFGLCLWEGGTFFSVVLEFGLLQIDDRSLVVLLSEAV
jgi:hypothetical protein